MSLALQSKSVEDRLTPDELEYHTQIMTELNQAKEALNQANIDAVKAQGAIESWSRLLSKRYGLSEGDRVEEDGRLIRKEAK